MLPIFLKVHRNVLNRVTGIGMPGRPRLSVPELVFGRRRIQNSLRDRSDSGFVNLSVSELASCNVLADLLFERGSASAGWCDDYVDVGHGESVCKRQV